MSTDDGKSQPGSPKEPPGPPRRPTPTIELEAEEVVVTAPDRPSASSAHGARAGAGGKGAAGATPGNAEVPRAGARDLRGLFTHMAAGVLGGALGVVAAAVGLDRLPWSQPPADISAERAAPAADAGAIGSLEAHIEDIRAIAERAARQAAASGRVEDRVARIEATLKGLGEQAGTGGGDGAQAAALAARIAGLADRFEADLAAMKTEIAAQQARTDTAAIEASLSRVAADLGELRQRLDRQAAQSPGVPAQVTARLDEVDRRLAGVEEEAGKAGRSAADGSRARTAAAALAVAGLRRGVDSGRPFAGEFRSVAAIAPGDLDLRALEKAAGTGVPAAADLRERFDAAARAATVAERRPDDASWAGRLAGSLHSVVTVRRTEPGDGDDAASVLARMRERLIADDLAGALKQGERLQGPARAAMQSWLDDAAVRLAAMRDLALLESRVVADLGRPPAANQGSR